MIFLRQILEAATKSGEEIVFQHTQKTERSYLLTALVKRDDPWFAHTQTQRMGDETLLVGGKMEIQINSNQQAIVGSILVSQEFRRQRVAEALYREGAKWMAKQGMHLYASTTQTPEAKATWAHLDRKGLVGEDEFGKYVVAL